MKPNIKLGKLVKVDPGTGLEGAGGITLSVTSLLHGSGWSTPRPDRFTPGKDTVPII